MNTSAPTAHASTAAEQLKIVIVGHVDHGKSTVVGRLLHDTGSLREGKLEELQRAAANRGGPFEWANLMDALQAERDQNITLDTAQIGFRTPGRQYVIIDAPGHIEFLKHMVTGAAQAEAALLVIDAHEGVQENSRRHGYLLHLLGIRQITVLVNKMDLADFSQARFNQIEAEFRAWLQTVGLKPKTFIPIVARQGDNMAARSSKMPWWTGPTVLDALGDFRSLERPADQPLRLPIQDVYHFDHRRILAGRVESGRLKIGDRLLFSPENKLSTVKSIESWSAPAATEACAGESVGITLTEQIFVERGALASHESPPPYVLSRFKARVFWLGRQPLLEGGKYKLKLATQESECQVDEVIRVIDASTLNAVERVGDAAFVRRHEVAELVLKTRRPIAFDTITEIVSTGRFVIVDGCDVAGGGIILEDSYPRRTSDALHKSHNIYWTTPKITAQQRTERNGHAGCVIWLTGLSGAGKSTVATELERELFALGKHVYVLDGDNIRHGLCADLGFSPEDRCENIRRIGAVARLFADAGFICITAFISPYRPDRDAVRRSLPVGSFIEVFVNAPIEVCEQRDAKGLYARARAGEIPAFTGISAPYEPPTQPEIELRTDRFTASDCVRQILHFLRKR